MVESNPTYFEKVHDDIAINSLLKIENIRVLIELADNVKRLHLELFDAKKKLRDFIAIHTLTKEKE